MSLKSFFKSCCLVAAAGAVAVGLMACNANEPGIQAEPGETPVERMIALDGTTIDGVDVSGLTEQEIRDFFADDAKSLGKLLITCGEDVFELDASSVMGTANIDEAIAEVYFYDESAGEVPGDGAEIALKRSYDLTPISSLIAELSAQMTIAPVDATYTYDKSVEGAFVYTESIQGRTVDSAVLFEELTAYVAAGDFSQPMAASFTVSEPALTTDQAKAMTTLVCTATSSFAKGSFSGANRVYNMEKALSMFDGYVLMPGEEFSFNTVLGPRYTSTGWKSAGAINNGKSVDEPGGGVCQVSSTAFNAVLMADLEIVERAPHSWPLSYLPAGQDATINTGTQDFIFKNNRTTPVILSTNINKDTKEISVSIYGAAFENFAYIQLESERTGTISQPADEVIVDETLQPGERVVDRDGRSGSTYKTYKLYYDAAGNLIERVFAYDTRYRAISSIIYVGPSADAVVDDSGTTAPPPDDSATVGATGDEELPPSDEDDGIILDDEEDVILPDDEIAIPVE